VSNHLGAMFAGIKINESQMTFQNS